MKVRSWARRLAGADPVSRDPRRAATLVQRADGWVWPHWLQRQLDPTSPAFVSLGDPPSIDNRTARNWTTVGTLGADRTIQVDGRGLVSPADRSWSIDWWIGAEDTWHVPACSANVRQGLVDGAPVVETRMRVPGGDIVHRVDAVRETAGDGGRALALIEVTNDSAVPVALAFAVRPYDVEGVAGVRRVEVDGVTVRADDEVALLLPREPRDVLASTSADGDVASTLFAGGSSGPGGRAVAECDEHMAQAVVVFALTHRTSITVAVPLDEGGSGADLARYPAAVPPVDAVARGWSIQTDRGMRLVLPDERAQEAFDAARSALLLQPTRAGHEIVASAAALDHVGYHDDAAERLLALAEDRAVDGRLGADDDAGTTGAALWAMGLHWDVTRDEPFAVAVADSVAEGVEWIERTRDGGLLSTNAGDQPIGLPDRQPWDDLWALAGMRDAVRVLEAAEAPQAAGATLDRLRQLRATVRAALEHETGDVGSLAAVWPLDLVPADDPAMAPAADAVRDRACVDDAVIVPGLGVSPGLTMHLGGAELAAEDPRAIARFERVLAMATPTWTWPTVLHPRTGGGSAGTGHDPWTTATFVSFLRTMLLRETDQGLALCSAVPARWLGQGIEVHGAPTRFGPLSFAVRWHGPRPALLWELDRHDPSLDVVLTCPGLDPTWRTADERGEALLAEPPQPTGGVDRPGSSFA